MKFGILILFCAASAVAIAQTPAKPTVPNGQSSAIKKIYTPAAKLPPGVPVVKGVVKTAFSLKYEDTKIGTGAEAEPNKVYWVHYTGWLAADGHKFDSSYDHPASNVMGKDLKPVMGEDGKPKQAPGQPFLFPQGFGRAIPGWDLGFEGMKIGGKRRLFVPYQLAYGVRGKQTGDPKNPGIPPKSDLIFDVELLDVSDMPAMAARPGMGGMPNMHPVPGGTPPRPAGAAAPGNPAAPGATPPAPAAAPSTAAPPTAAPATPAAAPAPSQAPPATTQPEPK